MTMTKCLYALALAICSVALLMLWATGPAQAEPELKELATSESSILMAARDAFACPGMHAEWLDEHTVQCLRVKP